MAESLESIEIRCSFCGKSAKDVRKMIAGPDGVHICDECVRLCREIVDEELPGTDVLFYYLRQIDLNGTTT